MSGSVLFAAIVGGALTVFFVGMREIVRARRTNRSKSDLKKLEELQRQLREEVDKTPETK